MTTRRNLLAGGGAAFGAAFAPPELRLASYNTSRPARMALWDNARGPHLRGAVFAQRRVYRELDGNTFLGPGPLGAPVSQAALDSLAEAGANLAVWSGAMGLVATLKCFFLLNDWRDRLGCQCDHSVAIY